MEENSNKEYVECLKRDDFSAFDALYHKYSEKLYSFCLSITHTPFAAEEITQLVFLKIWEKRALIDEHLSFKSFLFSIAYNETISWIRKEKSEKIHINEFVRISGSLSNDTDQRVEFKSMEEAAYQLIETMPQKRKEIFKMSRDQGYSNKEIAEKLDISVKTVENQMTSALKYLRERFGKQDIVGLLFYFLIYHS